MHGLSRCSAVITTTVALVTRSSVQFNKINVVLLQLKQTSESFKTIIRAIKSTQRLARVVYLIRSSIK